MTMTSLRNLQNVNLHRCGRLSNLITHDMDGGSSQVREDADICRLLLGLDVQEAVRVPYVRIVAPNFSKARR